MVHVNPYLLSSQLCAAWRAIPPLEVSLLPTGHCTSARIRTIRLHGAPQQRRSPVLPSAPHQAPCAHLFRLCLPFLTPLTCSCVHADQSRFERDVRRHSSSSLADALQASQMALVVDFNSVIGGDLWRTNSPASLPAWTIGDSTTQHVGRGTAAC